MDICYIDEQTKTAFVLTEAGYASYNPETGDFDAVLDRKQAREMRARAKMVSPSQGKSYALAQLKQNKNTPAVQPQK